MFYVFTLAFSSLKSQQVQLSKPREISICAVSAVWTGMNLYANYKAPLIPSHYFTSKVTALDRFSVNKLYPGRARVSDITAFGTVLLSATITAVQPKETWMRNGVVLAQTLWITSNVNQTVKMLVHRARPYTQPAGYQFTKKDDFYSFISGHSSMVSAAVTSAILMRNRNQGTMSLNGQKWMLVSAGVLGASTAVLRVLAGKHYPTDVLAGLLTGMGIAYINYKIHEK